LLAARYRRVAVISGRPVAYLAEHLARAGDTELVGLYGLERLIGGSTEVHVEPAAQGWLGTVAAVAAEAERRVAERRVAERRVADDAVDLGGVLVERKGLTVTLHYRQAPELAEWVEAFAEEHSRATGLVAHPGKMSVELRPPVPTDKGTVVNALAEGLSAVCYVGDDTGDLPAFEALEVLRDQGLSTLAVAVRSGIGDETPPVVLAAADLVVEGPEGVVDLLRRLAGD
jgi:trehalose 6-phosphate phosphatase